MPSILDAFPFPWSHPDAEPLHDALTDALPNDGVDIAARAGLSPADIFAGQPARALWRDILNLAGRTGMTRPLVQKAYNRLAPLAPPRALLGRLLAEDFLDGTDQVTKPEALLYHDDLTVEVGRLPGLIATLQVLVDRAPAVCRLAVDFNGSRGQGTAFRVGPDLLLTNWHVVYDPSRGRATTVSAEFGYEDDGRGGVLPARVVPCEAKPVASDALDDWAVVRAAGPLDDAWPVISLREADEPKEGDPAYVIQHPGGERKRLGFVRNRITAVRGRVVHYLTDTQEGSSGSPVFDAAGRLIALHRAGGRPQELLGVPPVKKNEGVRASQVLAGLTKQGVAVP